jgi:two-component system response regulator WspF
MRIAIVNDSVMAREVLRRVVLSAPGHEVAWQAADGAEALAQTRRDPPDLILMDLYMPGTDGVEATRRIMGECPCPILIVTATVSGHIGKVYEAMGYGALDAVDTPVLGAGGTVDGSLPLLRKLDIVSRLTGKSAPAAESSPTLPCSRTPRLDVEPLVVIGASTGGPFALAEILSRLPAALRAGVVIVQHVDSCFARGLGQWLTETVGRPVELAVEGSRPTAGRLWLSGTGDHLLLGEDQCLHYSVEPRSASYRPSVDVFFRSVACHWPQPGVGVLLTGMGRDGAEGLLELRRQGWQTIAQDEATSVIWGMPRAAVELGAARRVLPLSQIAAAIQELLTVATGAQTESPPR